MTTDTAYHITHETENLIRSLRSEAKATRDKANQIEALITSLEDHGPEYTAEAYARMAADLASLLTHRSNVHPESAMRSLAMLTAHTAVASLA